MQAEILRIDLQQLFPSLFTALAGLKQDPYEAGRLLRRINDVACCFIIAHARGNYLDELHSQLTPAQDRSVAFLRDFGASESTSGSAPCGNLIKVDELAQVVGMIHAAHALANWSWTSSFESVNGESRVQRAIDEMEERFAALLYQATIDYMFEGDTDRVEVFGLDWGWDDAQESDDGINDDVLATPPSIQYIPDDTPIEYTAVGPKVPLDQFCTPYMDAFPPNGRCVICCYDFTDPDKKDRALVLARCRAKHPFHEDCLDEWVNQSAMENANRCPYDREMLCEGRKRKHLGG